MRTILFSRNACHNYHLISTKKGSENSEFKELKLHNILVCIYTPCIIVESRICKWAPNACDALIDPHIFMVKLN